MTKNNTAKNSVIVMIYEDEKPESPVYSLSLSLSRNLTQIVYSNLIF